MESTKERLASLDAFRGFDILAMIFVNYLSGMAGVPFILQHAPASMDAFTLTDTVFPGFLFIVGVAIPLSLEKRIVLGDSLGKILKRISIRTASLLFLGVIMVNEKSYTAAAAGMNKELWYFLAYAAAIGLWMTYPKAESRTKRNLYLTLRIIAALILVFLVIIFRGQTEDGIIIWLQHSWWGILGMIGWCYLAGSFVYLLSKGNRASLLGALGFMIALTIGGRHGVLDFLKTVNDFVNVGNIFGSHAAIVTAGMLVGTLFTPKAAGMRPKSRVASMAIFGIGLYLAGHLLRPIHGFSKIQGTESFALATSGICCLLFAVFYGVMDLFKVRRWAAFLQPVGANPLVAYLLPSLLSSILSFASYLFHTDVWKLVSPFWQQGGTAGMLNAVAMTGFVLFLTWLLTRWKIVLKI